MSGNAGTDKCLEHLKLNRFKRFEKKFLFNGEKKFPS